MNRSLLRAKEAMMAPRGIPRNMVTDAGWEKVYELLMENHLVEVPDNFYQEHIPFKDPAQLEKIFTRLEEKNLFSIGRVAEIVIAIEF